MSEAPSDEQLRRALKDGANGDDPPPATKAKRGKRPRRKRKAKPEKPLEPEVVRIDDDLVDEAEDTVTATPAADNPPAAPVPEPDPDAEMRAQEMDEVRRQLADMRDQMESMSAAKDQIEGVAEKFTGMEDRMGNLLQLSELLSIQYNPFLEDAEEQVFEGRHEADELIQAMRERKRGNRPPRPGSELVRPDQDEPVPLDGEPRDEEPLDADGQDDGQDDEPEPEAHRATQPERNPSPSYTPPPMPAYKPPAQAPVAPVGRSREAYLALCWLEHIAETAPEGATHLLLDHYRRLGWVGEDDYTWLSVLAHSVSVPTQVSWSDFDLSGPEMARFHRENMTFLDRLFHQGFEERDPGRWQDQARRWLEGQ